MQTMNCFLLSFCWFSSEVNEALQLSPFSFSVPGTVTMALYLGVDMCVHIDSKILSDPWIQYVILEAHKI